MSTHLELQVTRDFARQTLDETLVLLLLFRTHGWSRLLS